MEEVTTDTMDAEMTMKPVYRFEWDDGSTRKSDDLQNDSPDFREAGVECLAERGRADPECDVTLVGFTEV